MGPHEYRPSPGAAEQRQGGSSLKSIPGEMPRESLEGVLEKTRQKDVPGRGGSLGTGIGAKILRSLD